MVLLRRQSRALLLALISFDEYFGSGAATVAVGGLSALHGLVALREYWVGVGSYLLGCHRRGNSGCLWVRLLLECLVQQPPLLLLRAQAIIDQIRQVDPLRIARPSRMPGIGPRLLDRVCYGRILFHQVSIRFQILFDIRILARRGHWAQEVRGCRCLAHGGGARGHEVAVLVPQILLMRLTTCCISLRITLREIILRLFLISLRINHGSVFLIV